MKLPRMCSVLVADEEALARRGLMQLLSEHPQLKTCAEAESIAEAREHCAQYCPTVLVMDPAQIDGFTFLKDLPRWSANTRVVVLTRLEDAGSVQRAFQLGAYGYLTRRDPVAAVLSVILGAITGERQMGPTAQRVLLSEIARGAMQMDHGELARLSHRECDVFRKIGAGHPTRLIAEELHLSVKTVETHRQRIKEKLGFTSGSELLRCAVLYGEDPTRGTGAEVSVTHDHEP